MARIENTIQLLLSQPPTSGRLLIPDSGQATCTCSQLIILNDTYKDDSVTNQQNKSSIWAVRQGTILASIPPPLQSVNKRVMKSHPSFTVCRIFLQYRHQCYNSQGRIQGGSALGAEAPPLCASTVLLLINTQGQRSII